MLEPVDLSGKSITKQGLIFASWMDCPPEADHRFHSQLLRQCNGPACFVVHVRWDAHFFEHFPDVGVPKTSSVLVPMGTPPFYMVLPEDPFVSVEGKLSSPNCVRCPVLDFHLIQRSP